MWIAIYINIIGSVCSLLISDLSLMHVYFAYLNLNWTFYDKYINVTYFVIWDNSNR